MPRAVRWITRALTAGALAVLIVAGQSSAPSSAQEFGGEIIVIDSISVASSPAITLCGTDGQIVLPMTIVATFLVTSGDFLPTGPYATGEWSGGFGSEDDHYGTSQAHDLTQTFHVLLTTSTAFTGPGEYEVDATVQDVGLAGGYATDSIETIVNSPRPFRAASTVKCPVAKQFNPGPAFGKAMLKEVLKQIVKQACSQCAIIQSAFNNVTKYGTVLLHGLKRAVTSDPPDNDYQQVADPSPPPVPPQPAGLTKAQVAALTSLESLLAAGIADVSGMQASEDRMWGAGNADSAYWYQVQAQALAGFDAKASTDLASLPAAYATTQAAFAAQVPVFAITSADAAQFVSMIVNGLPADVAADLTQLGETPPDLAQIQQDLLSIDESQLTDPQAGANLFTEPADFAGGGAAIATLGRWASGLLSEQPPVVTGLSTDSGPASGGTTLTVEGSNLATVTGISFGPSTPTAGLGTSLSCEPESCTVTVPPGTGAVDVIASGPGGPSARTPADRFTYVVPPQPTVTRVFPTVGAASGGTSVQVFGAGLAEGSVYFGPTLASDWSCTDTSCTATSPGGTSTMPMDVQVVTGTGTSPPVAGDRFSYVASPPPPAVPTVTSVSPRSGNVYGGEQITITGSGFTGATDVYIGGAAYSDEVQPQQFTVVDDSHITLTSGQIGDSPGTFDVTVMTSAGTSAVSPADRFTYTAAGGPRITSVSPGTGPTTGGTPVTVTGVNLNDAALSFGQLPTTDAVCGPTQCTVTSPPAAAGQVSVQAAQVDGTTSLLGAADAFTYTRAPDPVITSIEPATSSTAGGHLVTVLGRDLNGGTVTIAGQPAQDTGNPTATCGPTSCTVDTPQVAKADQAAVVVTRPDGAASRPAALTYVLPSVPVVTAIVPSSGWLSSSTSVIIFGENLADTTSISFGGTALNPDNIEQCMQDQCAVTVPAWTRAGSADVTVRTPFGTNAPTAASRFTFLQPTVTAVSPRSGLAIGGTTVTVTGTNLSTNATIYFNFPGIGGESASGWQCTDTTCTGPSPEASSPGPVDVYASTGDGLSPTTSAFTAADKFTYLTTPAPVISSVSPDSGPDIGGDLVTVTGDYLTDGTLQFGGSGVTTSCTQTRCTGLSAGSSEDGPADVTVQTPAGVSAKTAADTFTYRKPGVPSITGISPPSGPAGGGTRVVITGTNLTSGDVEFGGIPATDVICTSDTSCSAVVPAAATGPVDVTVHAFAGASLTTPADAFTYLKPPPPTVSAISPATGPQTGGTAVTVTGTNLLAGTVSFGSATAIDSSCTQTTCTATQPPGSPGSAGVIVQTAGGTSASSAASSFNVSAIQVSEVPVPGLESGEKAGGGHVYAARDGTIWFTMPTQDEVGHIAADGTITTYPAPDASALPVGITQTADGTVWYTEENTEKLVSIAPDGKQTVHDLPGHADDVRDITVGPDGRLWMPLAQDAAVIAMTTSGATTIYRLPDVASYPLNIVAGPDGRLWFTEPHADAIGAITTSGQLTEYPLPAQGLEPWGICVGPDGRLWFTEAGSDNLGAITTDGVVTQYPLSSAGTTTGITSGPDGRLWFTVAGRDELSALDPVTGTQADYSLEPHETLVQPNYLTMSSDGTLWASEFDGGQMIRLTGATVGVAPSVHGVWPDYGPPAGGTPVTVGGANLSGATAVMFGSRPATSVTDMDAEHVLAVAPAGAGAVTVTVVTPHGTTTATAAGVYHYGTPPAAAPVITAVGPATGVTSGGGKVMLTGSGLAGAAVRFGTRLALSSSCTPDSCTVTAPPGTGQVNVIATTAAGPSATSPADVFTYLTPPPPLPTVTRVSPVSGPSSGGTKVTVTGTQLAGGIVSFGLTDVPTSCTATSCTAVAPPGGSGIINLQVITAAGISAVTSADRYTYLGPRLTAPRRPSAAAAWAPLANVSRTPQNIHL